MRKGAAVLLAVATAIALYALVFIRVVANRDLLALQRSTDRIVAPGTNEFLRVSAAKENLSTLARVQTASAQDQVVYMLQAVNLQLLGRHREAEFKLREATKWGRRPEILVALASSQAANGKAPEAVQSLYEVARFDPSALIDSDRPHLRDAALDRFSRNATRSMLADAYLDMAIGYLAMGFLDEGIEMAAQAAVCDPSVLSRQEFIVWGANAWHVQRTRERYYRLATRPGPCSQTIPRGH